MKMTGDPGLPGLPPLPPSGMRSGVATRPGVPGHGSRNPFKDNQGVAGGPGGREPAPWTLWMTSTGLAPLNPDGLLPQVVEGRDGPMHLPEVAAGMTSMIPGICHIPETPTITTTSGLGIGVLTPGPVSDPAIPGMLASGHGTLSMTGDS